MSRDADGQQRLWLSLGYRGKTGTQPTWRYWKTDSKKWIISAPNELAEFELHDKTVFYKEEAIFTGKTQWSATWQALAYFYEVVVPSLPVPPIRAKGDA